VLRQTDLACGGAAAGTPLANGGDVDVIDMQHLAPDGAGRP
jgi:hypothetical protein